MYIRVEPGSVGTESDGTGCPPVMTRESLALLRRPYNIADHRYWLRIKAGRYPFALLSTELKSPSPHSASSTMANVNGDLDKPNTDIITLTR